MPTLLGALPGFSALATRMMQRKMEKLDIPPIPEFVELIADSERVCTLAAPASTCST